MLTITLLGEQSVVDSETGRIRTPSAPAVALLGMLIQQAGTPLTRTTIAGRLWPESEDKQALTNLRRELHALRRLLGDDDSLEVEGNQLCWHDRRRHQVDLAEFLSERTATTGGDSQVIEHGSAALEQYAGPLMPGVEGAWVEDARADLREACLELCTVVASAATRAGRLDVAVRATRRRIRLEPYDEEAHRSLMRLHARLGERGAALNAYHRLAEVLERDLAVAPSPETGEVLREVLDGPASTAGTTGWRPAHTSLVSRARELDVLLATWRTASQGQPQVVLVRGGAGVGKTRLVAELADHVRREGAVVASARCFDTSGRVSLAPVADWLREPAVAAARTRLPTVWRHEAERLVPPPGDGRGRVSRASTPVPPSGTDEHPAGPDIWQRHRFFEGLARSLQAASPPLLLLLDDLQWCDEDTLAFLTFLLGLTPDAPLLVAVTARADTRLGAVQPWLDSLKTRGLLREVELAPLSVQETGALAAAVSGEEPGPDAALRLHSATGGFPLYVVEATRGGVTGSTTGLTPDDVSGILRRRLAQTSPAAREVAAVAAAVGRDFTLPLLVECCDLTPETVVVAVDELWRERLVREYQDGYDFAHDLLRTTAYHLISPPRRWLLHRRVAEALERVHQGRTEVVAAQIAEQYRQAGDAVRALTHYRSAANAAVAVFAHAEAIALLDRALALLATLPPGRDRDLRELDLLELASPPTNAWHGFSSPQQRRVCERSVELADQLEESTRLVTATVGLWASRFVEGRLHESFTLARQAVDAVEPGHPRFGQAHFSLAGSALHLGDTALSLAHFAIARASVGDEPLSFGTRARVHTTAWWAHAWSTAGDHDRAADVAGEATAEARRSGHRYSLAVARSYEAITRQLSGDTAGCRVAAQEVRALCERHQFSYYSEWGRILEGWAEGGPEGCTLIEQGLARLEAQGAFARMPYWFGLLAQTESNPERAARAAARARELAARHGEAWQVPVT